MSIFFFLISIKLFRLNCILFHVNRRLYNSKNNKKNLYWEKKNYNPNDRILYLNGKTLIWKTAKSNTKKNPLLQFVSIKNRPIKTMQNFRRPIKTIDTYKFLKSNRKILCLPNRKTRKKKKKLLPLFAGLQPGHLVVNKTSWRICLAQRNS